MSATTAVADVNALLNPVLFQVIGSTPRSIMENIKKAALKGNAASGIGIASSAAFASAVNKATLENFLMKQELIHARPAIASAFSISGKVNMTSMTLLGHCILTSSFLDDVTFVKEFRYKMGQHDLWAGDFSSGSLSEKQKKIYAEKKRVTPEAAARLLGTGFFKYIGVDKTPWTGPELDFWEDTDADPVRDSNTNQKRQAATPRVPVAPTEPGPSRQAPQVPLRSPEPTRKQQKAPAKSPEPAPTTPPAQTTEPEPPAAWEQDDGTTLVLLMDRSYATVDTRAAKYYLAKNNSDLFKMAESIKARGSATFDELYVAAATRGVEAAMKTGASTVGR